MQGAECRVQSAVPPHLSAECRSSSRRAHAHGVPGTCACACAWTQVTRLSLERDMLEAEYARMAIGSGRSAAERRRKVAPHTYRTHAPRAVRVTLAALPATSRHETHCGMRHTVATLALAALALAALAQVDVVGRLSDLGTQLNDLRKQLRAASSTAP